MKQNMCVTIDEEVHIWLRKKPEMMSRLVNGILMRAMMKEMQEKHDREMNSEMASIILKRYCPVCDTYQTGSRDHCDNPKCEMRFGKIEVVE